MVFFWILDYTGWMAGFGFSGSCWLFFGLLDLVFLWTLVFLYRINLDVYKHIVKILRLQANKRLIYTFQKLHIKS